MKYDGSIEHIWFRFGADEDLAFDPDVVGLEKVVGLLVEV